MDFNFIVNNDSCKPDDFALGSFEYIFNDLHRLAHDYFILGFHLAEFDRCKYFLQFGYSNIFEFSFANFGLEKTFVSRCINVFYSFCQRDHNICKMFIKKPFDKFSYSQLVELKDFPENLRSRVPETLTVKELRHLKKLCSHCSEQEALQYIERYDSFKFVATSQKSKTGLSDLEKFLNFCCNKYGTDDPFYSSLQDAFLDFVSSS